MSKIKKYKPIKITIPDTLTKEQEAIEIGHQLYTKALPGKTNLIGTGIDIKELRTVIVIDRKSIEKPIEYVNCPVCNSEYQSNLFKKVFTNYGGVTKTIKVCSLDCAQQLINLCGDGRASTNRKKLIPVSKS